MTMTPEEYERLRQEFIDRKKRQEMEWDLETAAQTATHEYLATMPDGTVIETTARIRKPPTHAVVVRFLSEDGNTLGPWLVTHWCPDIGSATRAWARTHRAAAKRIVLVTRKQN